ncbi:MAG: deoxyribonuclease IV [bacterium]
MRKILGAHMSVAGNLHRCFERGVAATCQCLQIFTKPNNRWACKPITSEDESGFARAWKDSGIGPVIAHDSYLINLGSPDDGAWRKSLEAFETELRRCEQLGIELLVMHPGSHLGTGETAGAARVAEAFNLLHRKFPEMKTKITIETTAGQGTNLGHRFEQIAGIISGVEQPERLRVCFDTCHVWAAGYDLKSEAGYYQVFEEFDKIIGLERLAAFHINDSKKDIGSRVDRHAHIGEGFLGVGFFRRLMNDSRFDRLPMTLETPKGENGSGEDWDLVSLELLRSLIT